MKNRRSVNITINREVISRYGRDYFKSHPRAKNHPLAKLGAKDKTVGTVFPPNLNEMTNNPNRFAQNGIKQNWKDFVMWLCQEYEITNWNLKEAEISYKWVFPDRRRRDLDNLIMHVKFINDGLTNAGVWEDDCLGKIQLHLDTNLYVEKDNPQIIIEIKEIEE